MRVAPGAEVFHIATQARVIATHAHDIARTRFNPAVAHVVGYGGGNLRQQGSPRLFLDEARGEGVNVKDVAINQRIGPVLPQPVIDFITGTQRKARTPFAIACDKAQVTINQEGIRPSGQVAVQELRIGDRKIQLAALLGQHAADTRIKPHAEQVSLSHPDIQQKPGIGGVTAAQGEFTGCAFHHRGHQIHLLRP